MTAREMTKDEAAEKLVAHCRVMAKYWAEQGGTKEQICKGVAFSILVALDGGSMALPGFMLVPISAEGDREYYQKEGKNWWPNEDIGGSLHERFYERQESGQWQHVFSESGR